MGQQERSVVSAASDKEAFEGGRKRNRCPQQGRDRGVIPTQPAAVGAWAGIHPAADFDGYFREQRDHVRYWLAARVLEGRIPACDLDDVLLTTFGRAWLDREACRDPKAWTIGVAKHAL